MFFQTETWQYIVEIQIMISEKKHKSSQPIYWLDIYIIDVWTNPQHIIISIHSILYVELQYDWHQPWKTLKTSETTLKLLSFEWCSYGHTHL